MRPEVCQITLRRLSAQKVRKNFIQKHAAGKQPLVMSQRGWIALSLEQVLAPPPGCSLRALTEQTASILDIKVAVVEVELFENVDFNVDFKFCLLSLVVIDFTATLPVSG